MRRIAGATTVLVASLSASCSPTESCGPTDEDYRYVDIVGQSAIAQDGGHIDLPIDAALDCRSPPAAPTQLPLTTCQEICSPAAYGAVESCRVDCTQFIGGTTGPRPQVICHGLGGVCAL